MNDTPSSDVKPWGSLNEVLRLQVYAPSFSIMSHPLLAALRSE
jgi:hypothetical protein